MTLEEALQKSHREHGDGYARVKVIEDGYVTIAEVKLADGDKKYIVEENTVTPFGQQEPIKEK